MTADELKGLLALYVVGGGLLFTAIKRHRRMRRVQDTPRSKTASAPQGYCEFEGFAWPKSKTIRNLNEQEVVYHSLVIQREETQGSGKNKKRVWVTVFQSSLVQPIFLVDSTGLVEFNPGEAELTTSNDRTTAWSSLAKQKQEAILERFVNVPVPSFPPRKGLMGVFSKKFRVVESDIAVGCPLYAAGDFQTVTIEHMSDSSLRGFMQRVFDSSSRNLKKVAQHLDQNGDGAVSEHEAREGYARAAATARLTANQTQPADVDSPKVFGTLRSSPDHTLTVADLHEDHFVQKLKKGRTLQLFGGAALLTMALFGTFQNFWPKSSPARSVASVSFDTLQAHNGCAANDMDSCVQLLARKDQLKLKDENIAYYRSQLCKGGRNKFCR